MKKVVLLLVITFFLPIFVNAGRGCCSWHGGQDYCDTTTGKWVCKDRTYSPTCRCSTSYLEDNVNDSGICSNYINEISDLREKNENLQQQNSELSTYLVILILSIISYAIYKASKRTQ